ncbi:MAG TPA: phospholipid carrier-dependent glycosyltransferase [Marmoricola sp.]|nr:phospholipid carrier-dependent glycosyltransferase [Marmoricola sp.]
MILAPLVARLRGRLGEWLLALSITALAFVLRVWDLSGQGQKSFLFDETYYAKDAWSLLHFGYARNYVSNADSNILAHHTMGQWSSGPEMIVHPEVGKWLIALGEAMFGMNPFGWRIMSAVIGTLMVLLMIRFTKRITGSMLLGSIAGLLMCFDGLQLVLSRLALLDIFVAFFTLLAVHCMVADRQWGRARLTGDGGWSSRLWWRPWRLAAGLSWGFAVGSKWTPLFVLAAFCIVMWLWDAGARRHLGARRAWFIAGVLDGLPAVVYILVIGALIYLGSWTGWLIHHHAEEALANNGYGPPWGSYVKSPEGGWFDQTIRAFRDLTHYHHDIWQFSTNGLRTAHHVYQSEPQGWLILNRPVGVDAQLNIAPGAQGCSAVAGSTCLRQVLLLGTPALWWLGAIAGIWALIMWVFRRDWRYTVVVIGILFTWLPWTNYDDRPIFSYYAIVTEPFLILGLVLLLGQILGPQKTGLRRQLGAIAVGLVVALVAVNFIWFWPVYTDGLLTNAQWLQRIWFVRWI